MMKSVKLKPQRIYDPHVHFFDLSIGEYAWLRETNVPFWQDKHTIRKNFFIQDLQLNTPLELLGFVHIEAGFNNAQPEQELAWITKEMQNRSVSQSYASVAGTDLCMEPAKFLLHLNKLKEYQDIRGLRHIFDENAQHLASHTRVKENLTQVQRQALHFELQFNASNNDDTQALIKLFSTLPDLNVIVNHSAMAPFSDKSAFTQWRINIELLAALPNLSVKCSGFELISREYSRADMSLVLRALIDTFGEQRVMCASNFPLTLFSQAYSDYWHNMLSAIEDIKADPDKLCYLNTVSFYRLQI